jgi:hypothetical protein
MAQESMVSHHYREQKGKQCQPKVYLQQGFYRVFKLGNASHDDSGNCWQPIKLVQPQT